MATTRAYVYVDRTLACTQRSPAGSTRDVRRYTCFVSPEHPADNVRVVWTRFCSIPMSVRRNSRSGGGGWGVGACIGSGFTTYLATILNVNAYTRKLLKSKSNRYVVV